MHGRHSASLADGPDLLLEGHAHPPSPSLGVPVLLKHTLCAAACDARKLSVFGDVEVSQLLSVLPFRERSQMQVSECLFK